MGMIGLADKATGLVADETPRVLGALGRIKIFIFWIPILSVLIGIATQKILPERHGVIAKFELGSFVLPGENLNPIDLAEEEPMYTRIRSSAKEIREKYDGALLLSIRLEKESPVVTVTATANGLDESTEFLNEVLTTEMAFQNDRLTRFTEVFEERKDILKARVAESSNSRDELLQTIRDRSESGLSPGELNAMHSRISRLTERIGSSKEELNDMKFLQTLDLYIGKSEVTVPPRLIAKSSWYRPLIFGIIGLAVGLILVFFLCIFTVFRTPRGGDSKA